ncbi:ATP-dependent DNA helicase DDX11 isoform X2 [Athalia rosae]|uniref:ATP-dependent DNA helicase DDX11 isoform X2 n=1 Tax=Athalia rosae TaxID=37344 RepID=UPI00203397FD|nr:ATP-dependent DNA helicase DDX11 isoform X2 [Athalia rosae]
MTAMEPPVEFAFPFPAYQIQKDFMKELYMCLENGDLGIFESPTGTGKSLSIICGAVKWLLDHEDHKKNDLIVKIAALDTKLREMDEKQTTDWFSIQTDQLKIRNEKQLLQNQLDLILKNEEKMSKIKQKIVGDAKKVFHKSKAVRPDSIDLDSNNREDEKDHDDDDLILEDLSDDSDESDEETDQYQNTKIYYCSRTHTQLSQFIGELKQSPYSSNVRLVPLASRMSYCINKNVKRLKHSNLINEKCLQLQRKKSTAKDEKSLKKSKVTTSCPFLPGNQEALKTQILGAIKDVEDVSRIAQELNTCAYYSSRNSVEDGQVIILPYNSILHKSTRLSLGINLKGNVLIIDEAHNLLDAIERMHSAEITGRNLLHSINQLTQYQNRFESRFSPMNLLSINQLSFCLKKLIHFLGGTSKSNPQDKIAEKSSRLYTLEEFETAAEIDTINLFKLIDFVKNSKLCFKLQKYMDKAGNVVMIHNNKTHKSGLKDFLNTLQGKQSEVVEIPLIVKDDKKSAESQSSSLMAVINFLECLKNNCSDGRVFLLPASTIGQAGLKFVLLNPAAHFIDIVTDARAVVLAGGTMEPISEFKDQLFASAGADPKRIRTFTCGHVVSKDNILATVLTRGPSGTDLEFNYQNRDNKKILDEVGRILSNLCNIAPGGMVVFLPSYKYEITVHEHLEASGILKKLSMKKRIFREPKLTSEVEKTLEDYTKSVNNPQHPRNGSLLFSVIGGKLSEGLNFSDNLGRCIVVIGMPYPNIKSPELQEKIKFLNENMAPNAGSLFYENLCMKAVNQCIGRAIRHINDYAAVVLLDKRYTHKSNSLPTWLQNSLVITDSFPNTIRNMAKFFADRKKSNSV